MGWKVWGKNWAIDQLLGLGGVTNLIFSFWVINNQHGMIWVGVFGVRGWQKCWGGTRVMGTLMCNWSNGKGVKVKHNFLFNNGQVMRTNTMRKWGDLQLTLQLGFLNYNDHLQLIAIHVIQLQLRKNNYCVILMHLVCNYHGNIMLMSFFIDISKFNTWHYGASWVI